MTELIEPTTDCTDDACHCELLTRLNADLGSSDSADEAETIADHYLAEAEEGDAAAEVNCAVARLLEYAGECDRAAARFIDAAEEAESPEVLINAILSAVTSLGHVDREEDALALLSRPWGLQLTRDGRARIRAARASLHIILGNVEAAAREVSKAHQLGDESDDDRTLADIWEAHAVVAKAMNADDEELRAWYQCSGALRNLIAENVTDVDLRRFAHARFQLGRLHAGKGNCALAATVLDEAINYLWARLRPDRDSYDGDSDGILRDDLSIAEGTVPTLIESLSNCVLLRVEELRHVGRSAEAAMLASTFDKVLAGYAQTASVLETRGDLNRVLGDILRNDDDCECALDRYRRAGRAYRAVMAENALASDWILGIDLSIATELSHLGNHDEAVRIFDESIPRAVETSNESSNERLAHALDDYARSLEELEPGRCADAAAAWRKAAELRLASQKIGDRAIAGDLLRRAAESLAHQSLYDDAHAELDRAMTLLPDDGLARIEAQHSRAKMFEFEERFEKAAEAYAEGVRLAENLEGTDRAYLANLLTGWANTLCRLERGGAALAAADRAIAVWLEFDEESRGEVWAGVAGSYEARAQALITLERFDEVAAMFTAGVDACRAAHGKAQDREAARLLGRRAKNLAFLGDEAGVLATHEERMAILKRLAVDGKEDDRTEVAVALLDRAELLETLDESDAAVQSFMEALNLAADISGPALFQILDFAAIWLIDSGEFGELFEAVVEGIIDFYENTAEDEIPRDIILYVAGAVRALADTGRYAIAAKLVDAALRYSAPDGQGAPEMYEKFLTACRTLTRAQLRNLYAALPNDGATLRLILGKEGA